MTERQKSASGKPKGEGPYAKLTAFGTVLLVVLGYLALAYPTHWPPFNTHNPGQTGSPPTSGPIITDSPTSAGASPGQHTFLSDVSVDYATIDFKNGAQQIGATTYPNSVRFACGFDHYVEYPASGDKVLTAVVGAVSNDASGDSGARVTVIFAPATGNVAATTVNLAPGNSQSVNVSLPASVQSGVSGLEISCSISPDSDSVDVVLGNAALA
jgi:hypothetical protein